MHLTLLRIVNFRNHQRTEISLGPGLHVFVGANAQGKSNLLEAVGTAATGRSHRTLRDAELIYFGEAWARVHVAAARSDRITEVDVALRRDDDRTGPSRLWKELRVNGIPVRRGELFGHVLVVTISPEDHDLVIGQPRARRRMMDIVLAQESPSYFFAAQRYARVLLQRNQVLRAGSTGHLEGWDEQVATLGAIITARRRELVRRLAEQASAIYRILSGSTEQLILRYMPSLRGDDEPAMIQEALSALATRRREELARGATVVGPHRDDLLLEVDGCELRLFGSRGQQQTALLAVRLAARHVLYQETGEEPILLLDDALLALDEERQAYVLDQLQTGQTLLTLTTMGIQHHLRTAAVYRVAGGTVEQIHAHRA